MRRILVTGSEGLIGSVLCKKLQKKYSIIKFDIKKGEDILNSKHVMHAIKGCHGIIHLAAHSRVITAFNDPMDAIVTNILGTANILECVRQTNPHIWFVYASSREVYGETKMRINEDYPTNPINVYGVTKLSAELIAKAYRLNYGIRSFIVRFSNVYGSVNDYIDRVIPRFMNQAITNSDITVYGGTQTFDFVHVDDATNGIISLINKIENGNLKYDTYHFVTGRGTNLIELARKIIKITNSSSCIKKLPPRSFDVNNFIGNPIRARNDLNWKAKVTIDKGLKAYLENIKKSTSSKP
jgi:nucleoside-diphosphate-sugar epimerase